MELTDLVFAQLQFSLNSILHMVTIRFHENERKIEKIIHEKNNSEYIYSSLIALASIGPFPSY